MAVKRECGECTLCCKLLPIPPLGKLAGTRCQYQRHGKGCTVHGTAQQPRACKLWFCRWLINDDAGNLRRPDRAHYVIDMLPDEIVVTDENTGERTTHVAVQIWVDGDAWKDDDALGEWMLRKAEQGFPTLVRYSSREAVGVFAPPVSPTGKWVIGGGTISDKIGLWNK